MKRNTHRIFIGLLVSALLLTLLSSPRHGAAAEPERATHTHREQLIGAWQLVSIQVLAHGQRGNDPFYNGTVGGVLIYDAAGWMSVQIATSPRPAMDTPASRPRQRSNSDAQTASAVLDTYYAYIAEWSYDESTSKVTHKVSQSLIPDEAGKSYSQTARVEGDRLIFTVQRPDLGAGVTQEKLWKRMPVAAH